MFVHELSMRQCRSFSIGSLWLVNIVDLSVSGVEEKHDVSKL